MCTGMGGKIAPAAMAPTASAVCCPIWWSACACTHLSRRPLGQLLVEAGLKLLQPLQVLVPLHRHGLQLTVLRLQVCCEALSPVGLLCFELLRSVSQSNTVSRHTASKQRSATPASQSRAAEQNREEEEQSKAGQSRQQT